MCLLLFFISAIEKLGEPRQLICVKKINARRALTGSSELFDWRRAIVDGKVDRRDVTISQLSGPGGTVVVAWRLVRAWPARWSGPSYQADGSGVAQEEIELRFDDLIWLAIDSDGPSG